MPPFDSPPSDRATTTRRLRAGAVLGGVALGALLSACIDSPTGPRTLSPSGSLSASKAAPTAEALAKAAEKAAKAQEESERRLAKAAFDSLKKEWDRYKKSVEKGDAMAVGLRCEPSKGEYGVKRIGPKGGTLDVGLHTIEIPAGALAQEMDIGASVKPGASVELEFAPHGLQFRKPVEITFDYGKCVVADGDALDVVYVGTGWRILETMPSTDKRGAHRITALTDHFSGYMVSTGRRDTVEE